MKRRRQTFSTLFRRGGRMLNTVPNAQMARLFFNLERVGSIQAGCYDNQQIPLRRAYTSAAVFVFFLRFYISSRQSQKDQSEILFRMNGKCRKHCFRSCFIFSSVTKSQGNELDIRSVWCRGRFVFQSAHTAQRPTTTTTRDKKPLVRM